MPRPESLRDRLDAVEETLSAVRDALNDLLSDDELDEDLGEEGDEG